MPILFVNKNIRYEISLLFFLKKNSNPFIAVEYAPGVLNHITRIFSAIPLTDVVPPYHFKPKKGSGVVAQSGATLRATSPTYLSRSLSVSSCSRLNASNLTSVHGTKRQFNVLACDRHNKMPHRELERF